jgi:hypothetical protein
MDASERQAEKKRSFRLRMIGASIGRWFGKLRGAAIRVGYPGASTSG